MIGASLKIISDGLKWAKAQTDLAAKAHASALSAAAFRLRQTIKEGMKAEAPAGQPWPPTHPWTLAGIGLFAGQRKGGRRTALGKFAAAARYQRISSGAGGTTVRVGFLDLKLQRVVAYHTAEHEMPVSLRARRKIFATGGYLRAGGSLRIPARPIIAPIYERFVGRIPGFVNRRIQAALTAGRDPKALRPPF